VFKAIRQFFQRQRRQRLVLTVCWLDDAVSFLLWDDGGKFPSRLGDVTFENGNPGIDEYRQVIRKLLRGTSGQLAETRWIVFRESLVQTPGSGKRGVELSAAMLECCNGLEAEALPSEVLSATALLESGVYAAQDFGEDGTGFCTPFGRRLCFVARGNGEQFRRLSRAQFIAEGTLLELSSDWLRQTLVLYRNKTGLPLGRVRLSWKGGQLDAAGDLPVDVEFGWVPPDWPVTEVPQRQQSVRYLHRLAVYTGNRRALRMAVEELERRRRFCLLERRLRIFSALLIGGWVFLLFAACQQKALLTDSVAGPEQIRQREQLERYQQQWAQAAESKARRAQPFEIVGTLAEFLPKNTLDRHIEVTRIGEHSGYTVRIGGFLVGGEPLEAVHSFVRQLEADASVREVVNLEVNRSSDRLYFEVETAYPDSDGGIP
jgi:hypothetical protein